MRKIVCRLAASMRLMVWCTYVACVFLVLILAVQWFDSPTIRYIGYPKFRSDIFHSEGDVDVVLLGNSYMGHGVSAEILAQEIERRSGTRLIVQGLSQPAMRVPCDAAVARDLLDSGAKVKMFILNFAPYPNYTPLTDTISEVPFVRGYSYTDVLTFRDLAAAEMSHTSNSAWRRAQSVLKVWRSKAVVALESVFSNGVPAAEQGAPAVRQTKEFWERTMRRAGGVFQDPIWREPEVVEATLDKPEYADYYSDLAGFKALVESYGAKLVLVEIPKLWRDNSHNDQAHARFEQRTGLQLLYANSAVINTLTASQEYWADPDHLELSGCEIFTSTLAEELLMRNPALGGMGGRRSPESTSR